MWFKGATIYTDGSTLNGDLDSDSESDYNVKRTVSGKFQIRVKGIWITEEDH